MYEIMFEFFSKKKNNTNKTIELPIPTHLKSTTITFGENDEEHLQLIPICKFCDDNILMQIEASDGGTFVKVKCPKCGKEQVIFDASEHGWDGFVCHQNITHSDTEKVVCSKCKNNIFEIVITIYSQGKEDFIKESQLIRDDGTVMLETDWVNAFDWITIDAVCNKCTSKHTVTDYETM